MRGMNYSISAFKTELENDIELSKRKNKQSKFALLLMYPNNEKLNFIEQNLFDNYIAMFIEQEQPLQSLDTTAIINNPSIIRVDIDIGFKMNKKKSHLIFLQDGIITQTYTIKQIYQEFKRCSKEQMDYLAIDKKDISKDVIPFKIKISQEVETIEELNQSKDKNNLRNDDDKTKLLELTRENIYDDLEEIDSTELNRRFDIYKKEKDQKEARRVFFNDIFAFLILALIPISIYFIDSFYVGVVSIGLSIMSFFAISQQKSGSCSVLTLYFLIGIFLLSFGIYMIN